MERSHSQLSIGARLVVRGLNELEDADLEVSGASRGPVAAGASQRTTGQVAQKGNVLKEGEGKGDGKRI